MNFRSEERESQNIFQFAVTFELMELAQRNTCFLRVHVCLCVSECVVALTVSPSLDLFVSDEATESVMFPSKHRARRKPHTLGACFVVVGCCVLWRVLAWCCVVCVCLCFRLWWVVCGCSGDMDLQ